MGKISEIFNFDNIGGKIKSLAKWSCWITILLIWIVAPIVFIALLFDEWTAVYCWIPLVAAIIGPVFVWIGSWAMYALGEFVENTQAMKNKYCSQICDASKDVNTFLKNTKNTAQKAHEKSNFEKTNYCECGEIFHGMYCPICGKTKKPQPTANGSKTTVSSANTLPSCPHCGSTTKTNPCEICGKKFV